MLELGEIEHQEHQNVGMLLSSIPDISRIILVGARFKSAYETALEQGFDSNKWSYFDDIESLLAGFDLEITHRSTTLYIKASNGTGLHKLVNLIENQ